MSGVALVWILGTVGLLAWSLLVSVLWHVDGAPPRPVMHPSVPRATIRVLFVEVTDLGFVVDGLLDIEGSPIGVPTTWTLEPPHSDFFSAATLDLLERWSDDGDDVTMDLSRLHGPHPSVAMSRADSLVRLPVLALSPHTGNDHFAHP